MRKFMLGGLLAVVCTTTAFAKDFPYVPDDSLVQRYYTNGTTLASYELVEVPQVGDGMLGTENVAVITMTNAVVTALDEDGWTESTNKLTNIQAAFTLKSVSDDSNACVWMGYTGGGWKEFDNETVGATPGTYTIKIEIDYTLTLPKVRYSVDDYVMKQGSDEWVPLGKEGVQNKKVKGVQLCGYGTTGAVEGTAGTRAAEGTFDVVEDVSANYESIRLGVVASTERWGVDGVTVKVKNSAGQDVVTVTQTFEEGVHGTNFVDLAEYVHPGETYTYDVSLTDSQSSRTTRPVSSDPVDLFSSDVWFAFVSAENAFTNATTTGIVIADHKFSAADEEIEGTITPTDNPKANIGTVVETTIDVANVCTDLQNYTKDIPQFAVALGGNSTARIWKYCENGVWMNAEGDLPTGNGSYIGRATFDYTNHTVKYEIKGPGATAFQTLVAAAALPNGKAKLDAVGLLGGGTISAMQAMLKLVEPAPVVPDEEKKEIVLDKNGEVDLANLDADESNPYTVTSASGKKCHLKWTDDKAGVGKFAVMSGNTLTVKQGAPANGLASYDSYVLGLNAEESTSKPAAVVVAGQDQSEGVVVNVPNLKDNRAVELGHTIKLRLESKEGTGNWTPVSEHDVTDTVTVPLFNNPAKQYRVNTIIK